MKKRKNLRYGKIFLSSILISIYSSVGVTSGRYSQLNNQTTTNLSVQNDNPALENKINSISNSKNDIKNNLKIHSRNAVTINSLDEKKKFGEMFSTIKKVKSFPQKVFKIVKYLASSLVCGIGYLVKNKFFQRKKQTKDATTEINPKQKEYQSVESPEPLPLYRDDTLAINPSLDDDDDDDSAPPKITNTVQPKKKNPYQLLGYDEENETKTPENGKNQDDDDDDNPAPPKITNTVQPKKKNPYQLLGYDEENETKTPKKDKDLDDDNEINNINLPPANTINNYVPSSNNTNSYIKYKNINAPVNYDEDEKEDKEDKEDKESEESITNPKERNYFIDGKNKINNIHMPRRNSMNLRSFDKSKIMDKSAKSLDDSYIPNKYLNKIMNNENVKISYNSKNNSLISNNNSAYDNVLSSKYIESNSVNISNDMENNDVMPKNDLNNSYDTFEDLNNEEESIDKKDDINSSI